MRQVVHDMVNGSKYRLNDWVLHPDRPPDLLSFRRDLLATNLDTEPPGMKLQLDRGCLLQHLCEARRLNPNHLGQYFYNSHENDWNCFCKFQIPSSGLLEQWRSDTQDITTAQSGTPPLSRIRALNRSIGSLNPASLLSDSIDTSYIKTNDVFPWSGPLANALRLFTAHPVSHHTRCARPLHHCVHSYLTSHGIEHWARTQFHNRHSHPATIRFPTTNPALSYNPVHPTAIRSTSTSCLNKPHSIPDELFLTTLNINRFKRLIVEHLGYILDVFAISTVAASSATPKSTEHASRQFCAASFNATASIPITLKLGTENPDNRPPNSPRPLGPSTKYPLVQATANLEDDNDGNEGDPPDGPPIVLFPDPEYE